MSPGSGAGRRPAQQISGAREPMGFSPVTEFLPRLPLTSREVKISRHGSDLTGGVLDITEPEPISNDSTSRLQKFLCPIETA